MGSTTLLVVGSGTIYRRYAVVVPLSMDDMWSWYDFLWVVGVYYYRWCVAVPLYGWYVAMPLSIGGRRWYHRVYGCRHKTVKFYLLCRWYEGVPPSLGGSGGGTTLYGWCVMSRTYNQKVIERISCSNCLKVRSLINSALQHALLTARPSKNRM